MSPDFDPSMLPLGLLIWPVARSVVFIGAAAVSLWSRNPARRAEARRLLRLVGARSEDDESR